MMKIFELNFSYKGTRAYIQGPDMLNQCMTALTGNFPGNIENIEFTIHRMTGSNLFMRLYPRDSAPDSGEKDIAVLKFRAGDQSWQAILVDADTIPAERHPYDEAPVIEQCEIDEKARSIMFTGNEAPYSDIETLVSMNKALHQKLFPDTPGQWVFCGWRSARWPLETDFEGMRIQLVKALGTRLTDAEVGPAGEMLGSIYFSARTDQ
jgi:hypothetical protein